MNEVPSARPSTLGPRLAVVLLLLLALITFLGTLAAPEIGVLAASARYFEAVLVWQPVAEWFEVPLPGARLLLLVLFLVLVLDRNAWRPRPGRRALPVVHGGVALLLATGLWSAWTVQEGSARIAPGGSVREVQMGADTWSLPFELRVREVRRDYHPGTDQPARFEVVVDVDPPGEPSLPARITLHAPLHRDGVTVHLSGDPEGLLPVTAPVDLAFRRDPADAPRLLACLLLGLGLLTHFAMALWRHVGARA